MADGTQAFNLPPQVAPAVNAMMAGGGPGVAPQVAPGPRTSYNLPAPPQAFGPLAAPAGLPVMPNPAIPQGQVWTPPPPQAQPTLPQAPTAVAPPEAAPSNDPLLGDAWKQYAAGIKDHAPTLDDFNKFAQWYQTRYVDPHLTGLKGIKPAAIKAYQAEFAQRAQDLGDQMFPAAADNGDHPVANFFGAAKTATGGELEKMLGGGLAFAGALGNRVGGGTTGDSLMAQGNSDIQHGLNQAGQNREQFLQMMLGHNYGSPQFANLQQLLGENFDKHFGGDSSLAAGGNQSIQQAAQKSKAGAIVGQVAGGALPIAAATIATGGADLPVLAAGGGAALSSTMPNVADQMNAGQDSSAVLRQGVADAGLQTLMNALPVHTPGANVLKRMVQAGAANAAMSTGQQVADKALNPGNGDIDWKNVGVQSLTGLILGALGGNKAARETGNPLLRRSRTGPAPDATQTAAPADTTGGTQTPPGGPAAAPALGAGPAPAMAPDAAFHAAVNVGAPTNGAPIQQHVADMAEFSKELNSQGKRNTVKKAVSLSTDPASLVESATALAKEYIPGDKWNSYAPVQRQFAIETAASYLAKKANIDPAAVSDTIQKFANPPAAAAASGAAATPDNTPLTDAEMTAAGAAGISAELQANSPSSVRAQLSQAAGNPNTQQQKPVGAAGGEQPLPGDISGQQVPGTAGQAPASGPTAGPEQMRAMSGGSISGENPVIEAQLIWNVATGASQDPMLSGSPLGQSMTRLIQGGQVKSPADVQTAIERMTGKQPLTPAAGTPSPTATANKLKAAATAAPKTNAQQAAEHAATASTVAEALSEKGASTSAKNKLKARVASNAADQQNQQFMQAVLNHGVSSGAAEDAIRADPHFMAVRQAVQDGRVNTPADLGTFLANERTVAEQANQQVAAPVVKPKGLAKKTAPPPEPAATGNPLKKEGTPSPKSEAPVANTGAATTDLEGQIRGHEFAEKALPQHRLDELHDAISEARLGDRGKLTDILTAWKDSGDIDNNDAQWIRKLAKSEATPTTAVKTKAVPKDVVADVAEARAHASDENDDYLNDEYHQNNASGESSASLEAQNRLADERSAGQTRAIIRRDGSVEHLTGVDAVDTHARPGEVVAQRGVGKNDWTILSHGDDLGTDAANGKLNRAKSDLNDLQNEVQARNKPVAPTRDVDVPGFGKVTIDQTHDVELLGGSPNKGNKFYADKDWKPVAKLRMKDGSMQDIDRSPFLGVHELRERALEQEGLGYTEAHNQAEREEDAAVAKAGIDPKSYQESYHGEIAEAAKKVNGKPPKDIVEKPYEHPHSVRAREALRDVQDHEQFGPHGEYTLHMDDLEHANDERNASYAGTEKQLDRVAPLQTKRRVGQILNKVREGADIHETGSELQKLHEDMETAKMEQRMREAARPLRRGTEYVRQRLQEMIANNEPGSDHYEAGKFAQWLLEKNPNLGNYLAIRIHDLGEQGPAGRFSPIQRLAHINSVNTNPGTAVHEIMHSAEQLMPTELQNKIRGEYIGRLQNKIKQVTKTGNTVAQRYLQLAAEQYAHPSLEGQKEMSLLMRTQQKAIPYDEYYKYSNPSEYWAVESTDMLNNKYLNNGFADKLKQWLGGFFEHVKSLLGLDSNHQISRALDAILKTPGEAYNDNMLAQSGRGARDELNDEKEENPDEEATLRTSPNRPTKAAVAQRAADAASAETRGYIGKVSYGIEQLANARIGIEKAMQGLRRSGVEVTPENNTENAAYLAQGKISDFNNRDSYDTIQPARQWIDKNYQRFSSNKKEFLDNVNTFFQNTHWLERVKTSWMMEAPMTSASAELQRAKLLDDVEQLKIKPEDANKKLQAMTGQLKYGWEQWGRNHNVPIDTIQGKLNTVKSKYGMDQGTMGDLNTIMDGARERQTQRLQGAGFLAKDDPWTKFYNWKWYVPLKSSHIDEVNSDIFDSVPDKAISLARLNQQVQAMEGRSSFAEKPFMRLFVDTMRAGAQHAGASVKDTIYNLASDPKSRAALGASIDTWDGVPHDGYTNTDTGEKRTNIPVGKNQVLIHDGRTHYVVTLPNDSQLLRGLVQMNNIERPNTLERGVSKVTNTMARLDTTVSPVWQTLTAFVRDLSYVPMTLAPGRFDNPLQAVPFFTKYAANAVKGIGAVRQLTAQMSGNLGKLDKLAADNPGGWADWTHRYMAHGGSNEFVNGFDIAGMHQMFGEGINSLPRSADGVLDATKLGWNNVLKYTGRYADFVTQIPRVAAFRTLVEQGVDEATAAAEARKVLDYSQSGVKGRRINSWLAFFRVGATGVDAMRRAFTKPTGGLDFPKLAKWSGFYSALGAMGYMASSAMLGQDENGEDNIKKMLPETIASRILFPIGDNTAGWQIGLGLPQLMMAPGALMAAVNSGNMTMEDAAKTYAKVIARNSAFEPGGVKGSSPVDFAASLLKGFTPTVTRPILDVANNTNSFGYSIHNEARGNQYHADAGKTNTPDVFKEAAQSINSLTNGAVDFYPEDLEYLVKNYGGQWATTLLSQAGSSNALDVRGASVPGFVHDQDFYQNRQLYSTLDDLNSANQRYNAVVNHAVEGGATPQQAQAQAEQMLLQNPELRQQRQLYSQLASAASARAAAMKALQANKFMSQQGKQLQMKTIDSKLRQTLDTVQGKLQQ